MYTIHYTGRFKKDLKLLKRRSINTFGKVYNVVLQLEKDGISGLDTSLKPHPLKGNFADCYECHVLSDYLLIWKEDKENQIIELIRTGTHADLFGK
jgi:mRNA interferase YafQ